jgi:hypothetical protein
VRYAYVGPDAIRRAAAGAPQGTAICDRAALDAWLTAHPDALSEGATYVISLDGTLRLAERRSEHVACAGGQSVLAAGELRFTRALTVAELTNQSTGYCPEPSCFAEVSRALTAAGLDAPAAFTRAFIFRRCDGCGQINLVKDDWYVCGDCNAALPSAWNF